MMLSMRNDDAIKDWGIPGVEVGQETSQIPAQNAQEKITGSTQKGHGDSPLEKWKSMNIDSEASGRMANSNKGDMSDS